MDDNKAQPERSEWKCYLFGNTPQDNTGVVWIPAKGQEPNWFVRWTMKVCFACTWEHYDGKTSAQPEQDATMQSLKDLKRSVCDEVGKAAFAQPAQEPVAWQFMNGSTFRKRRPDDFSDLAPDGLPYWRPLYTATPQQERNFCPRCGKRTADLTTIHTCTPPHA